MTDREIFKPFVELTARFNSTTINKEYKDIIIKDYDLVEDGLKSLNKKITSMFEQIETDPIYQSLKKGINGRMESRLLDILNKIYTRIEKMNKGLYHWDHKPRNMGWSERQQKYVLFDLEDTLWGPRFYNIGMWIGGDDKDGEKYASREEIAKTYLDIYNERNKTNISVDCLLDESYPLWVAYKLETLLYYYYESGPAPYRLRDRDPKEYKAHMEDRFIRLINLLCNLEIERNF